MSEGLVCFLIIVAWANGVVAGYMYFSPHAPKNRQELVAAYKEAFLMIYIWLQTKLIKSKKN